MVRNCSIPSPRSADIPDRLPAGSPIGREAGSSNQLSRAIGSLLYCMEQTLGDSRMRTTISSSLISPRARRLTLHHRVKATTPRVPRSPRMGSLLCFLQRRKRDRRAEAGRLAQSHISRAIPEPTIPTPVPSPERLETLTLTISQVPL